MKNLLIGIIVGIGNIIPGLSGSALLIIFNLYEKCINSISNILKDFKKSFLFLLPIGIGIILGTFLFSNIIEYLLTDHLMITSIVFVGFLIGTIPTLFKEATKKGFKESYVISFLIAFSLGVLLLFFKSETIVYEIDYNLINILKLFFAGILLAASTIIPGISSTVLFTMVGMYGVYIKAISTLNIAILIPIVIGLIIGGFILSKIIKYLLNKYYGYTFFAIVGFTISTIPSLFMIDLKINIDLLIGILFGGLAFILTNYTLNLSKKS